MCFGLHPMTSIVIYIHCIKVDVNAKLYPAPIPHGDMKLSDDLLGVDP